MSIHQKYRPFALNTHSDTKDHDHPLFEVIFFVDPGKEIWCRPDHKADNILHVDFCFGQKTGEGFIEPEDCIREDYNGMQMITMRFPLAAHSPNKVEFHINDIIVDGSSQKGLLRHNGTIHFPNT